ncbi:aspartyl-tRNA synthetase [Magnaporthiopsis poae ATCC 64411]|uniref:Probable aspartate--tRNA ligase, cytoplasmic n=1 Tax=Magnaporthiopsis poae (strain ATCC 64411 / 73-15) TaxID=644358 RepID=A0A0C4DS60_MAGP6|nr:aspartyl-tRNA synthetase [Magnaporthiopsis poae ATCC 64411]
MTARSLTSLAQSITGPLRSKSRSVSRGDREPRSDSRSKSRELRNGTDGAALRAQDDSPRSSQEKKAQKNAEKKERRAQEQALVDEWRHSEDMKARERVDDETKARYGDDVVLRELSSIAEIVQMPIGSEVTFRARIHHQRDVSRSLDFLLLRDQTDSIQGVLAGPPEMVKWAQRLQSESIVQVTGRLQNPIEPVRSASHPNFEVQIGTIHVVARARSVPFSNYSPPEAMNPRLSNRVVDLRHPANQALFRVRAAVTRKFRETLGNEAFVEIQTPKLQPGATESGAEVFKVNYFGRNAFLAQSPQLSKQMAISADFKRVYEIGPVFRAENSNTHRHLTEYTGLDIEMSIEKSYHEVIDTVDRILKSIFATVAKMDELKVIRERWPSTDLVWLDKTPIIPFPEALEMLREDGNVDIEEDDLSTRDEIRLGELVKKRYGTDYFILDKFPAIARPFYTHKDDDDPKWTNSFDVFLRGQEIGTGGQRIHDVEVLRRSMTDAGITEDGLQEYLAAFEAGAPPHGGAGLGLERIITFMLELGDVRIASPFHRDTKSLPRRPPGLPHPEASTKRRKSIPQTPPSPARTTNGGGTPSGSSLTTPSSTATTTNGSMASPTAFSDSATSSHPDYPPLEKLIANYGDAANTSWLDERFQIWRHPPTGAAVGYVPQKDGKLVIMAGDPLCDPSQLKEVVGDFLAFVHNDLKRRPVWLIVSDEVQRILADEHHWRTLTCIEEQRIGAEVHGNQHGHGRPGAERNARRVQREGIRIHEVRPEKDGDSGNPSSFRERADRAIEQWHAARTTKQIHITEVRPWVDMDHRRYFAAERDGAVLGLVVLARLAPRRGWQVKWALDMPGAPNGTIEALVDRALGAVSGSPVTFGTGVSKTLTPVAHIGGGRARVLAKAYEAFTHSLGLGKKAEFREKFGVVGEEAYICYPKHGLGVGELREIVRFFED